jgi:hypothetical protein
LLSFAHGSAQPRADPFLNHRPLELGEHTHHLEKRLAGGCRGVEALLVQVQINLERVDVR